MPWGVAAAAVGGLIAADGSRSAANTAADATNNASAKEMEMFNLSRQDQQPWMDRGNQAGNKLQYLLGLGGTGGAASGNSLAGQRLVDTSTGIPQYNAQLYNSNPDYRAAWDAVASEHFGKYGKNYRADSDGNRIEEVLRARLGPQIEQANTAQQNDPAYGSLMRNFSAADMQADPVYQSGLQFGLDEGTKGINRMAAASGNSLSGATLKALTRFGNDYGSTKANESFNRFNINRDSTYNKLAAIAGTGQTATNQVGTLGVKTGASVGDNMITGGMLRGAGAIGQTNALTGMMNNIYGAGKKNGWWGGGGGGSGGGLSDYIPQYAGTGNPFNWTNGDS
jgi:hypothetical protein